MANKLSKLHTSSAAAGFKGGSVLRVIGARELHNPSSFFFSSAFLGMDITVDCYRCSATIVVGLDDHTYENVLEKM